ncbi:MAG: hypothetical protein JRI68_17155 [Deltaproteobacteria bacterium]|nr:hypothetical protein [Deltaproteobacteria bacterium]
MNKTAHSVMVVSLSAAAGLVGCEAAEEELDPAEAVAAVELAETQSGTMPGGLLPFGLDEIEAGMSPEEAAEQVAATAEASFEPEGCATAEHDQNVVVYSLDGCIVRHGLGKVLHPDKGQAQRHGASGSFELTFAKAAEGFAIQIVGSAVTGRKGPLEISGTAELVFEGTLRTLSVTTKGEGRTPWGLPITRHAHHLRTYDSDTECLGLHGQWRFVTPWGARVRSVSGYQQCGDLCPEAGGELKGPARLRHRHGHRGQGDHGDRGERGGSGKGGRKRAGTEVDVTVQFDGSAEAQWSSSDGQAGTFPLSCEPPTG